VTTIIATPKTKEEINLLTSLFKRMNIEAKVVEEPVPNYETRKAMEDVERKIGNKAKNSEDLFSKPGI